MQDSAAAVAPIKALAHDGGRGTAHIDLADGYTTAAAQNASMVGLLGCGAHSSHALPLEPHMQDAEEHALHDYSTPDVNTAAAFEVVAEECVALRYLTGIVAGKHRTKCVLDQGCQIVAIGEKFLETLGINPCYDRTITLVTANGTQVRSLGLISQLQIRFGIVELVVQAHVIPNAPFDLLLGRPFFQLGRCRTIDFANGAQHISITDPSTQQTLTIITQSWPKSISNNCDNSSSYPGTLLGATVWYAEQLSVEAKCGALQDEVGQACAGTVASAANGPIAAEAACLSPMVVHLDTHSLLQPASISCIHPIPLLPHLRCDGFRTSLLLPESALVNVGAYIQVLPFAVSVFVIAVFIWCTRFLVRFVDVVQYCLTGTVSILGFPGGVRPSLGPMRDLVVVGGAAVGRRGSANYVGGCWRSSHIRCRKCAVGYAARNASAHHKAVHRQQRHHRQRSTWRSDHNRLLGSGGSAAASVMSSEAQNAHGARGTVGAVQ